MLLTDEVLGLLPPLHAVSRRRRTTDKAVAPNFKLGTRNTWMIKGERPNYNRAPRGRLLREGVMLRPFSAEASRVHRHPGVLRRVGPHNGVFVVWEMSSCPGESYIAFERAWLQPRRYSRIDIGLQPLSRAPKSRASRGTWAKTRLEWATGLGFVSGHAFRRAASAHLLGWALAPEGIRSLRLGRAPTFVQGGKRLNGLRFHLGFPPPVTEP